MTTIRRRKPRFEFVQILNAVARDYRISWRARGLLTELLSYPEGYETTVDELVKKAKRSGGNVEGRDAMRKAARELKDVGYIVETRYQNELGHWITEQEITDDPMYDLISQGSGVFAGQTDDGFSGVGNPGVGNPGVIKKTEKKTEKNILPPAPSKRGQRGVRARTEDETPKFNNREAPGPQSTRADHTPHMERAQTLLDSAVRLWADRHKAPTGRSRQRLSERIAAEIAAGGDETVIVHELSRDMSDIGNAVSVMVKDRTVIPGWGQAHDPRPAHSQHEIKTKTPWCGGSACNEKTRLANVYDPQTGETKPARCRVPIQDPLTGEIVACHPRATLPLPESAQDDELDEITPDEFMAMMSGSLANPKASRAELLAAAREQAKAGADKALGRSSH